MYCKDGSGARTQGREKEKAAPRLCESFKSVLKQKTGKTEKKKNEILALKSFHFGKFEAGGGV